MHSIHLRELHEAVRTGKLRLTISKLIASLDPGAARAASFSESAFTSRAPKVPWWPSGTLFPFLGSRFPYQVSNPKKCTLIIIWLLGYQGAGAEPRSVAKQQHPPSSWRFFGGQRRGGRGGSRFRPFAESPLHPSGTSPEGSAAN